MGPTKFTLLVTVGSSATLSVVSTALYFPVPDFEDSLHSVIAMIPWLWGTAGVVVSCPLWIYLIYEPWNRLPPSRRKNFLLGSVFVGVALFGLVVAAFFAYGRMLIGS